MLQFTVGGARWVPGAPLFSRSLTANVLVDYAYVLSTG